MSDFTRLSVRRLEGLRRLADKINPELFTDRYGIVWEITPTGWRPRTGRE